MADSVRFRVLQLMHDEVRTSGGNASWKAGICTVISRISGYVSQIEALGRLRSGLDHSSLTLP